MYSPGACAHRLGIYFRVGIYFPARHVLLFDVIKKKSRPQHVFSGCLNSPGRHLLSGLACTLICHDKKNSRPQHVLTGCLYSLGRHLPSV